jgi:hypothetical protein
MNLALALWLILAFTFLGYLAGHGRGQRRGRLEMAAMVEATYGPLFSQLEEFSKAVAAYDAQPGEAARRLVDERIKAMRKASPWN